MIVTSINYKKLHYYFSFKGCSYPHIEDIFILSSYCRSKIATKLIKAVIYDFNNPIRMDLIVHHDNIPARNLYGNLGRKKLSNWIIYHWDDNSFSNLL